MYPSRVDLQVVQNTDALWDFQLLDSVGNEIDISSDTIQLTCRTKPNGPIQLQFSNTTGGHADPTHGWTRFTIEPGNIILSTNVAERWWYDVRRITTTTEVVHVVGEVFILPV